MSKTGFVLRLTDGIIDHARFVEYIIEKEDTLYITNTVLARGHDDRKNYYSMTAKLIDDGGVPKLYSDSATFYNYVFNDINDYDTHSTNYTMEIVSKNEVVELFFKDSYLQSYSSFYSDFRIDSARLLKGYEHVY